MSESKKIHELPVSERPYERCLNYGPSVLSDGELLAVFLRNGTKEIGVENLALSILDKCRGQSLAALSKLSYEELTAIKGVGKVKAVQLMCLAEIVKRMNTGGPLKGRTISSTAEVAEYYGSIMHQQQKEEVAVILLDTRNRVIHNETVSVGNVNTALIDTRDICISALKHDAVSVILLHNHPSGDCSPSREDILTTKRIKNACEIIGVNFIDHIVIGHNKYSSLREYLE